MMKDKTPSLEEIHSGLGNRSDRHRKHTYFHRRFRLGFLAAAVLWLIVIFGFSSQPYQKQSIIPYLKQSVSQGELSKALPNVQFDYNHSNINAKKAPYQFVEFIVRKSAHLTIYAIYAILLYWAIKRLREHWMIKIYVILCIVFVTASIDEWNQTHVSNRTGIYQDVGIDLTGSVLGMLAAGGSSFYYRKISKIK